MATILDFPDNLVAASRGPAQAREQQQPQKQAQIIIFPGVRIERWEEEQDRAFKRRPRRAAAIRRDTLDLLD